VIKQAYSEESIQEILTFKENNRRKSPVAFHSTNTATLFFSLLFFFHFSSFQNTGQINYRLGLSVIVNLAGVLLMEGFNNMV
jgi:hypothetical protein